MSLSRRSFIKEAAAGAVGIVGISELAWGRRGGRPRESGTTTKSGLFFGYPPFSQKLFIPDILTPLTDGDGNRLSPAPGNYPRGATTASTPRTPTGNFADVAHGIAPEFGSPGAGLFCPDWNANPTNFSLDRTHEQEFRLVTEETTHRFVPGGPDVPIFTYRDGTKAPGTGNTPGPTILVDFRAPVVLRSENALTQGITTVEHDVETSIHLHGTHAPAHSDGYPDFYVLAREARDYFYPNIAPRVTQPDGLARVCEGDFDPSWIPTTLWYHDHAMDITGFNVSRGLVGFYLVVDPRERFLMDTMVIPRIEDVDAFGNPLDIGLALTDQRFNADGTLFYDFLDHNGRLGDVFTVNGVVQPFLEVERRKYRFRFLNASNARVYQIRLSTRNKLLIFGTDSWLLPFADFVESFQLAPGQRHDVIIDFHDAPDEVFVENIMHQTDGRRGREVDPSKERDLLLKFKVMGPNKVSDVTIDRGTVIRDQFKLIADEDQTEIVETRTFRFDRANGAFTVNNRFFNPRRADAVPELGRGAERWFFENSSGGWWHPIHTHLEGFQIHKLNGKTPPFERRFNSDLVELEGGTVAEVLAKFRTFTGPFVFHCHNIEHEDMRMMGVHDPTPAPGGGLDPAVDATPPLDGESRIAAAVSGVVPDCVELEAQGRIFFDEAGDLERLAGRGVGFLECEFDLRRRGNRGRED